MVARNPIVALLLTKPARRRATNVACACVCVGAAGHCPPKGLAPFANLNEMRKKRLNSSSAQLGSSQRHTLPRPRWRSWLGITLGSRWAPRLVGDGGRQTCDLQWRRLESPVVNMDAKKKAANGWHFPSPLFTLLEVATENRSAVSTLARWLAG